MNSNVLNAYSKAQSTKPKNKNYDAEVLYRAANKLELLQQDVLVANWQEDLHYNLLIWTVLQEHFTSGKANHLPDNVLANLVSLSFFIDKKTADIINVAPDYRQMSDLTTLININKNIAAGLMGDPGGDKMPSPEVTPQIWKVESSGQY